MDVGGVTHTAGWAKAGESFDISAVLRRTAEGLECFQMALQQKHQADEIRLSQPATEPGHTEFIPLSMRSRHLEVTDGLYLGHIDLDKVKGHESGHFRIDLCCLVSVC